MQNKSYRIFPVLALFLIFLIFLAASPALGEEQPAGAANAPQALQMTAAELKILGSEGEKLTYHCLGLDEEDDFLYEVSYGGQEEIGGVMTARLVSQYIFAWGAEAGTDSFVALKDGKFMKFRQGDKFYEPPWVFYDFPLYVGKKWTVATGPETEGSAEVVAVEDLLLPVGVLKNAFKVRFSFSGDFKSFTWLHPDYPGVVRWESVDGDIEELASFTRAAPEEKE